MVLAVILAGLFAAAARGEVIFVRTDGSDAANGTSWSTAYATLQKALTESNSTRNQIWVAQGSYYPDTGPNQTGNDPDSTFRLRNNIAVYGGFVGTESNINQRDLSDTDNYTILSGDLDQDGNHDNGLDAYHVLTCDSGASAGTILDGFTMEQQRRVVRR